MIIRIRISTVAVAILAFVGSLTGPLLTPQTSSAIDGSQFNAGRIIDDVVFFSSNTMSVAEIQNFLNAKVPVCDTWHQSSNPSYQPPFICLKDFRQDTPSRSAEAGLCNGFTAGNKSAAQIIYEVGQSCGINPQALMVLLQKEQALITDTWPLDIQYRSATGYGCPDTAACDSQYYGFFNQLYNAARQFRYYAKYPTQFNHRMGRVNNILYNPSASCGSSSVYIQNQATAGLYNYTPYQPNASALNNLYGTGDSCGAYGNRNFWRTFNDWFGASVIGASPSPLYKSTSTHTIYVIAGGQKYPVSSQEILAAYGLQKYPAAEVSQTFLDQYATGDTLTTIGKKALDPSGAFYLFDDGKRYPIDIKACAKYPDGSTNPTTSWGLDCFNSAVSKTLANELIDLYTVQDILIPEVIINQGMVWKLEGGKKRLITDPLFVEVLGGWGKAKYMKDINSMQPQGRMLILDESLVKFDNSPVVYYLVDAQLHPIPGPDEINAWKIGGRPSYLFPASYNASDPIPVSPLGLQSFARDSTDNPYVLFQNGTKASVAGKNEWNVAQYSRLPDYTLSRIPTVNLSSVYRTSAGELFTIIDGKRRPFPTGDDFYYSGHQPSQLQGVTVSTGSNFTYDGLKLSAGRLFKVTGSDEIRYVYGEGASLRVLSTNTPGLPYGKIITVDTVTGSRYPVLGDYR